MENFANPTTTVFVAVITYFLKDSHFTQQRHIYEHHDDRHAKIQGVKRIS